MTTTLGVWVAMGGVVGACVGVAAGGAVGAGRVAAVHVDVYAATRPGAVVLATPADKPSVFVDDRGVQVLPLAGDGPTAALVQVLERHPRVAQAVYIHGGTMAAGRDALVAALEPGPWTYVASAAKTAGKYALALGAAGGVLGAAAALAHAALRK
jgi:hypothetical protein